jgi:hypothetical protein
MGVHILVVDYDPKQNWYEPPVLFGPFDTVKAAQDFAEDFREANDLPREATSDNNEEWTEAGWYFGIFEPSLAIQRWVS